MPQYAAYDPALDPSPVVGYFDTDAINYSSLPATLYTMSSADWTNHLDGQPWAISGGAMVRYTPPVVVGSAPDQVAAAIAAGVTFVFEFSDFLNGVYACDAKTELRIHRELIYLPLHNSFSDGNVYSIFWPDIDGTVRQLSYNSFMIFAQAVLGYIGTLTAFGDGSIVTLPSNVISLPT